MPKGQPKHPYHPRLNRLACPPSFLSAVFVADWRAWTQEQIAQVVGLSRNRVSEIIGNTNFGEIDTLLSQGRDMDYIHLLKASGWEITHIIDCPLSTQRFLPNMVSRMQKNRTLGVVRRSLIIGRKK